MTVDELVGRFPEIPAALRGGEFLERFGRTLDEPLREAARPSNCAGTTYSRSELLYLKLIMPMDILNLGLGNPRRVTDELEEHMRSYAADPAGWFAAVVPGDAPQSPGGCQGG